LYNLAVLPRGDPGEPFEMAGKVTLIGKTGSSCRHGDGFAGGNHLPGFSHPGLVATGVGRQNGFLFIFAGKMKRAQSSKIDQVAEGVFSGSNKK